MSYSQFFMAQFTNGNYRIDIFKDQTFSKDSDDHSNVYDFVYIDKSEYQFASVYGIRIFQNDILIKSAVIGSIGGGTAIHNTSTIIENDRILVCCSDTVFCLSLPDLFLLWRTKADQVTCFEIYKYKDSYIIHGEVEISRLDNNGKILWQQSGADIFTTCNGKDSFFITDNFISATDWENKKYKFDFNGRLIE
jgi:hypothetical protein